MTHSVFLSALLCQLLAVLAYAAPIVDESLSATTVDNAWGYGTGGGILGFIVLVLDVIGIVEVVKSDRAPASKIVWCLVIFFFPLVGMAVYYLFSNRKAHNANGYEALP